MRPQTLPAQVVGSSVWVHTKMRHLVAKGNKPLRPSATCAPQQVIDHAARAFVAGSEMRKLHG